MNTETMELSRTELALVKCAIRVTLVVGDIVNDATDPDATSGHQSFKALAPGLLEKIIKHLGQGEEA